MSRISMLTILVTDLSHGALQPDRQAVFRAVMLARPDTGHRGRGRPSTYNDEIAGKILGRIAEGQSLASITKLPDMPAASTVFQWLSRNQDFADRYAHARTSQADAKFEQITEITEQVLRGEVDPHAGRVAIDAYKWQAGKLRPQVYGDRIEHVVRPGSPEQLTDVELTQIAARAATLTIEHRADEQHAPELCTEIDEQDQ